MSIAILVAIIGATGAVLAAIVTATLKAGTKLDHIAVMVDGRLDEALKEIKDLHEVAKNIALLQAKTDIAVAKKRSR